MREACLQFPSARSTASSCVTVFPRQGTVCPRLLLELVLSPAPCLSLSGALFSLGSPPASWALLGPPPPTLTKHWAGGGGVRGVFQLFAEPPLLLAFPRALNPLRTLKTYFQPLPLSQALDLVSAKLCHLTLSGSKPASFPPRGWAFPFGPLFGLITLLPGVILPPPFRTYHSFFRSPDPLPPSTPVIASASYLLFTATCLFL